MRRKREQPAEPEQPEQPEPQAEPEPGRLTRGASRALAQLLLWDPDRLDRAVELGLLNRAWLDEPDPEHLTAPSPSAVLERFFERTVEQRPSTLASLGLSAVQVLSAAGEAEGRDGTHEVLAVAFLDLEGFTSYTASHGDEAAIALLADHQRTVGPVVRSRGGRTVKHLGDGTLVTFPEPEAAVLAGLELVAAPPEPLRLRVGIHVGEVLVTRDRDVVGHVVNVAARVTDEADGGEVLVTGEVRDRAAGLRGVRWGRRRKASLRGVDGAVPIHAVLRDGAAGHAGSA